jgi:DNA primase large subunit
LSYFQSDFNAQVERRKFLGKIHRLISKPIVRGHEDEYLITQVLAEYLSHVRMPNFSGLLFGSAQRIGGTNVVLFPNRYSPDEVLKRFSMSFVKDSVIPYKTTKIDYEHEKLHFYDVDGEVRIYGEHDYDDDD